MHLPILLLVLLTLTVPSVSTSSQRELGNLRSPDEMTSGGLLLNSAGGLHEAPALSTDVDIQIAGIIARTRVVQRFSNPTTDWLKAYTSSHFPKMPRSTHSRLESATA
jgi:Ca-activated chloride channel family protein